MRLPHRLAAACIAMAIACTACAPRADGAVAAPVRADPQPAPAATPRAAPDASCRVDGDCVVKNVGNCCGYFPACVNRDAATDPEAVRAECERSGMASVCGWRDIQSCECAQNRCRAVQGPLPVAR